MPKTYERAWTTTPNNGWRLCKIVFDIDLEVFSVTSQGWASTGANLNSLNRDLGRTEAPIQAFEVCPCGFPPL